MNQFENHLGIFKWRSECIFVFFVLNHWSHCIRIMLMYNIASWIAENHNKLPKINSKHCCYLPFKAVDSWPWYEVGQTTKQCTNTHTWHITYLYRRCLLKSTANFFFVTVRFWTARREVAIIYCWCCWSYFMISMHVFGGNSSLHHIGKEDIYFNNCWSKSCDPLDSAIHTIGPMPDPMAMLEWDNVHPVPVVIVVVGAVTRARSEVEEAMICVNGL